MSYEQPNRQTADGGEQDFQQEVMAFLNRHYARDAARMGTRFNEAATEEQLRNLLPQYLKLLKLSRVFDVESLHRYEARLIASSAVQCEAEPATKEKTTDCVDELAFLKEVKEYIYRQHSRLAAREGRISNREVLEENMPVLLPQRLETLKRVGVHDIDSLHKFEALMVARYESQAAMHQPASLF